METFDQILFTVRGIKEFELVEKELSSVLNDKLQIKTTSLMFSDDMDTDTYSIIRDSGISAGFGNVDIIDVTIENGRNLIKYSILGSKEFAHWKLRNKMPFNVTLHPSFKIHSQAKNGAEINGGKSFIADYKLEAPLAEKKDPYSDIRD